MQLNTRDSLFCQGCQPRKLKLTNNPQFITDTMNIKNNNSTKVVTITNNTRQRISDTKMKSLF